MWALSFAATSLFQERLQTVVDPFLHAFCHISIWMLREKLKELVSNELSTCDSFWTKCSLACSSRCLTPFRHRAPTYQSIQHLIYYETSWVLSLFCFLTRSALRKWCLLLSWVSIYAPLSLQECSALRSRTNWPCLDCPFSLTLDCKQESYLSL